MGRQERFLKWLVEEEKLTLTELEKHGLIPMLVMVIGFYEKWRTKTECGKQEKWDSPYFKTERILDTKLIEDIETLRQGFASARDFCFNEPCNIRAMDAYHKLADRLVVQFGGESILPKEPK